VSRAVFLNTGIFIALMSQRDRWHTRAAVLFSGPRPKWITSILVVSETCSWFLHRMGEEQVNRILDRFRGTKLTYVDASSLVYLEQKKISVVWATDHHSSLGGAEVLPRRECMQRMPIVSRRTIGF
jgi:predicted nucleic acid-binding protein